LENIPLPECLDKIICTSDLQTTPEDDCASDHDFLDLARIYARKQNLEEAIPRIGRLASVIYFRKMMSAQGLVWKTASAPKRPTGAGRITAYPFPPNGHTNG